jgi:hypothetical protein
MLYARGRQVWIAPRRYGTAGWLGTDPIMVVGSYPSSTLLPHEADIILYRELRRNGLANAHLTDLLKTSAKDEKQLNLLLGDSGLVDLHQGYFQNEIDTLRPIVIVLMGTTLRDIFDGWLENDLDLRGARVHCVPHYTHPFFRKSIALLNEFCSKLTEAADDYRTRLN